MWVPVTPSDDSCYEKEAMLSVSVRGLEHWSTCGNDTSGTYVQVTFLCLQHVTSTMFSNFDEAIVSQNYCQWDINIDHQPVSVHLSVGLVCILYVLSHHLHCSYSLPSVSHTS